MHANHHRYPGVFLFFFFFTGVATSPGKKVREIENSRGNTGEKECREIARNLWIFSLRVGIIRH